MGADLELVVSEKNLDERLFREYLEYVQKKEKNIYPNKEYPDVKETYRYKIGIETHDPPFPIMEQLQRDIFTHAGPKNIYGVLGRVNERNILYGEEIEDLIKTLRKAKEKMCQEGETPQKVEMRVEAGPVALCEFALEHGYGVRLSE